MAFAAVLAIGFALQVSAQTFGLRALAEVLRREPARPTARPAELIPLE